MHGSPPIELRTEKNVKTFETLSEKGNLVCACTNHFVLLRDVPWNEMRSAVHAYCDIHDDALLTFFLTPANAVRKSRPSVTRDLKIANLASPEALSIQSFSSNRARRQVVGWHCSTTELQSALAEHNLLERYSQLEQTITPAWHIVTEPFEVQKRVAHTMLEPRIRTMEWARAGSNLDLVASARLIELLESSYSSMDFLSKVCSPIIQWFSSPVRKNQRGSRSDLAQRPLALAWFLVWLAERGLLLFPLIAGSRGQEIFPARYRHFMGTWIRPEEKRCAYDTTIRRVQSLSRERRDRPALLITIWNLIAPGCAYGQVTAECLRFLKDSLCHSGEEKRILCSIWKIEAARLKSDGLDPHRLSELTHLVIQWKARKLFQETDLWAWVDNPEAEEKNNAHYYRTGFHAGPNLKSHVADVRAIFPILAGKSAGSYKKRFSIWLYFLSSLDDALVPPRVIDIRPKLLASLQAKNDGTTLLSFLIMEKTPPKTHAMVFSALKSAWKIAARDSEEEGLLCPISDQLISFKGRGLEKRPFNTTRRAIDMEILELLIEENRANDFKFSQERKQALSSRQLDYRLVSDPETGELHSRWWPGPAVLMDVLLQIPLRHKQGRFLDSGEGDEYVLEISSLQLHANHLPTAQVGRSQAFIQRVSLSPLRDEPGLGMHINTNKTGREYTFPWLMKNIATNVQLVIDWQQKYNPISAPISDREDTLEERIAKADPVLVYPIFRDPDRHNHAPISSGIVRDYFRALMKHVEAKYNLANNTSVHFFSEDGEPIYDIHALRVTGVTRLLHMGVDPRIVRLLVGHASLMMTWYYEHVTNHRVAAAMEKALEARRPTREALLAMTVDDREKFLARLFNKSDEPTLAVNLLRGSIDERSPFLDMRVDGICPGQRCSDAGVWRTKACSLCKFNITGVPFLAGLELVLNDLMAEVILNQQKVAELRDQLYRKRRECVATRALEAEIAKQEEIVDHLLQQWEAQFQYVKKAESDLAEWLTTNPVGPGMNVPKMDLRLVSQNIEKMGLSLQESHHFALYTRLIEGAKRVEGFLPTIGAREARDAMLLEIVRHEHKEKLFYRLDPKLRRLALDQFALLLLEQDLPTERLSALIEGTAPLSDIQGATDWLERLGKDDTDRWFALRSDAHE